MFFFLPSKAILNRFDTDIQRSIPIILNVMIFHFRKFLLLISFIVPLSSCMKEKDENSLFTLVGSEVTGVDFSNTIYESDTFNIMTFGYIYNGGGVAVGDVNNDGLKDVFFAGNMVSSKLYLNKGNFQFEDITVEAGVAMEKWATGVTIIDINQDGLKDIYVCTINPIMGQSQPSNLLFINNGLDSDGNPVFTEEASVYGLDDKGYSTQAAFFDYDLDGDLDMYLLTNNYDKSSRNIPRFKLINGGSSNTDRLYRNNGNHTFTNVSKEAGILIEGWGLGVAVSDINKDGWPDIYVSNDFISNDLLWINNKNGTFTNKIDEFLRHQSYFGMGADIADYNNDGLQDIMVLDMMPENNQRQKTTMNAPDYNRFQLNNRMGYETQYIRNTLQINNGDNTFSEIGQLAGVYATDWSWSPLFADFDNDGWRDLFITNGFVKDITDLDYVRYNSEAVQFGNSEEIRKKLKKEYEKIARVKMPNYIYQNNKDLTFTNQSTKWGLAEPSNSNGAAYADLDNDGDLDLIVNNIDSEAFIYKNNSDNLPNANFLKIDLVGKVPNLGGIGTKIRISHKGNQQYYEHFLSRGYKSSMDNIIHFGLGEIEQIDSIEITWPDGKYQLLTNIKSNNLLKVEYKNAYLKVPAEESDLEPFMVEVASKYGISYKHAENDYVDFNTQPLIPHKHSQNGPGIAVGDVNGDGLEDFFIGGSKGFTGFVFQQDENGKFSKKPLGKEPNKEDDLGVLFFDYDADGDLDLYVVTGGNEYLSGSENYQHRLYNNDGSGNFEQDHSAIPSINTSGSCVVASDFDMDGDLDLFVGGRNKPRQYPLPGTSYILSNDGGTFRDVTKDVCPELENVGMVTSALWTDFDNDNQTDLIIVGEWMPITFYKNEDGMLKNVTPNSGLTKTNGWWNSLSSGDFDNDGDIDYVAGNLGLNSKFKATEKEPVSVYAKDFDINGTIDPILGRYILGEQYPDATRDALMSQIPSMRKKFSSYADYGAVTIDNMFFDDDLKDAYIAHSYTFESSYIENLGGGKFSMKALPMQAQFAPVFGMLPFDYNKDGNLDLMMVGNSFATETSAGLYDAFNGEILIGDGNGDFTAVDSRKSGFTVFGDAKSLVRLEGANHHPLIIVSQNSDSLKVFEESQNNDYQIVVVNPTDIYADLYFKNGSKQRREFYYGSGYISQNSRKLYLNPENLKEVYLTDFEGKRRKIELLVNMEIVQK